MVAYHLVQLQATVAGYFNVDSTGKDTIISTLA